MKYSTLSSRRTLVIISLLILFGTSVVTVAQSIDHHEQPIWSVAGSGDYRCLGGQVSGAGDVNGDGYDDVLVGETSMLGPGNSIFAYYGSPSGLPTDYQWSVMFQKSINSPVNPISGAGDVNRDGYDDVIIGTPYNADTEGGSAQVFYGSETGLSTTADWIYADSTQLSAIGYSARTAGDINGDGYADIVVGAPDGTLGHVLIFHGTRYGLSILPNWIYEGTVSNSKTGQAVAGGGDVNGDGYSDIVFYADTINETLLGFYGSIYGLSETPDWSVALPIASQVEIPLSISGDVNQDGYSDLVVGYSNWNGVDRVYVYLGGESGLSISPDWTLGSEGEGPSFGYAVDIAGDLNEDGFDEIIVSAPYTSFADGHRGAVYLYFGSHGGITPVPGMMIEGSNQNANYGYDIRGCGDTNGDQVNEFLVGAPTQSSGGYNTNGSAYQYSLPTATPFPPEVYRYFLPVVGAPEP